MGTNYFSVKRGFENREDFWELRGTTEVLHIGKSSGGWCFSLHIIPEMGINDLYDWVPIITDPDRVIIDEYRSPVQLSNLISIITARSRSEPCKWSAEEYERNYAEPGPNNLSRHKVGRGCAGQGIGTWDLIEGNFS